MKKLIIFDMDGVIFEHFNFWMELHKVYGTFEEGKELTEKYVRTNYPKLVEEVIGRLWAGKPEDKFIDLVNSVKYVEGVEETISELKKKGYMVAIISSGPKRLAERAKDELGIDYIYANDLVFEDGKVVGSKEMANWHIRHNNKAVILRKLCEEHLIDFKDVIVIGHDNADLKMAKTAGIAIGFCPDDEEFEKYCNVIIKKRDLREILKHID